jgi:5-formyltetrahydrofolate cyclo-ligase
VKNTIRNNYLSSRKEISKERKEEAQAYLLDSLKEMTLGCKNILSYYPLSDEVDVSQFNEFLQKQDRLLLPKVAGESLVPYAVKDMEKQLKTFSYTIFEPDDTCTINTNIDLAIIPGIVFDKKGARIGFGKGHYDRFLADKNIKTIGVCFKEQLYDGDLPLEPHDIIMERLCIV